MKNSLRLAFFCFGILQLQAQENLNQEVIDVVKDFRPKVMEATKIKSQPLFVDTSKVSEKLSYQIRFEEFRVKQQTDSLHALLLNRPILDNLFLKEATLGLGSLLNPHLAIDVSNGRSTLNVYHAYLNYDGALSSQIPVMAKFNNLSFGGLFKRPFETFHVKSNIALHSISRFDSSDQKQVTTALGLHTVLRFNDTLSVLLPRTVDVTTNLFLHEGGVAERKIKLSSAHDRIHVQGLTWQLFNTLGIQASDDFNYLHWKTKMQTFKKVDQFDVNMALCIDVFEGSVKMFPELKAQYPLIDKELFTYFELGGDRSLYSLRELYLQNPYLKLIGMSSELSGDLMPSNTSYFTRLGLNGNLFKGVTYQVSAKASTSDQFMQFVRISGTTEGLFSSIHTDYTSLNSLQLHAEIDAKWNEKLHFWLKGDYHTFDKHLSYVPDMELGLYAVYQYDNQWSVRSSVRCLGTREVLGLGEDPNTSLVKVEDLPSVVDFNLIFSFVYDQQIDFYLEALNLLNEDFILWEQNPVLGRHLNVGCKYRF